MIKLFHKVKNDFLICFKGTEIQKSCLSPKSFSQFHPKIKL